MDQQNKDTLIKLTNQRMVDGKRWIAPRGNPAARLMIVVDQPSLEDVKRGIILSKEDETTLNDALTLAGIPHQFCWFTSIFKGSTTKKATNKQLKEHFATFFQQELDLINPDLIITLGAEAFKMLFGTAKAPDWQGMVVQGKTHKLLATHKPYLVNTIDPMLRKEYQMHMMTAYRYLTNHEYAKYTYEVVSDPKRNIEIIQGYLDKGLRHMGLDCEWLPGVWNETEVLTDLSYSFEPNHSIVLNLAPDLTAENRELLDTMKLALERQDIRIGGWYATVDLKRLMHRGIKFHDEALWFDGMIATPLIDSRDGKGLDVGVYNHTNLPPYWVALYEELRNNKLTREHMVKMKLINPDVWFAYCAGDGVAHFQVNVAMQKEMARVCPQTVIDYYYKSYLPSMWYIIDMEMSGLPIDVECMEKMTQLYDAAYKILHERLMGYVRQMGITEYNPHYWTYTNKLFFDTFNLQPGCYTKKTKKKSRFWFDQATDKQQNGYNASTNAYSLNIMFQDLKHALSKDPDNPELKWKFEVLKTQVDLNKMNPFTNKFLNKQGTKFEDGADDEIPILDDDGAVVMAEEADDDNDALKCSYWAATGKNNRVYMNVFPILDNFRWSTTPNTQVLPSKTVPAMNRIFKELEPELKKVLPDLKCHVPQHIKNIVYGGHPDWVYLEADCMAADLGHVGYISKDNLFLDAVREKQFHVEMMRKYFNDPTLSKETHPERVIQSKTMTFNSVYSNHFGSAAWSIQGAIYGETGVLIPHAELERSLEQGWNAYPKYMQYKRSCEDMVRDRFFIENNYGMRLTFEPTSDYGVLARYINRALAWPVASSMALHMHMVAVNLRSYLKHQNEWLKWVFPANGCHDSHQLVVHKDLLKDNYIQEVVAAMFSKITPISTGDFVGVEMDVASYWKGPAVWAGKTKWNGTGWDLKQTGGH